MALVAVKIAGLIVVMDPRGLVAFDLPKSLFSRATEWLLLGLLVLAVLRFGLTIVPRTRLHLVVLAVVLVSALSTAFAENQYIALYGERARYLGLTFVVDMAVMYIAVAVAFGRVADWAVLGLAISASSVAAMVYAFVQRANLDPVRWSEVSDRPFAMYGNPDMFGHFLGSIFGIALGIVLFSGGSRWSKLVLVLAAVWLVAIVATSAVVATRGTLLAIAAALVLLPAVYLRIHGLSRHGLLRVTAVAAIGAIAGLALAFGTPLGERARATIDGAATQDRLLIYESAIRAFLDRPILGYGPNSFSVAYPRYRQEGSVTVLGAGTSQSSAHSWVFDAASTTGVAGLAALIALMIGSIWTLWRHIRVLPGLAIPALLGVTGYWANGLVSVGAIGVDWVPWVGAGAAAYLSAPSGRGSASRAVHWFGQVTLMTAAAVGALSGLAAFEANRSAQTASEAWRGGRGEVARIAGAEAVRLDAGRADHWNWLGLGNDQTDKWREAADAFSEAAARSPHRSTYWQNLARVRLRQALSGRGEPATRDGALDAAHRAISADPNDPTPYVVLSEVAYRLGDYGATLQAAVTGTRLYRGQSADLDAYITVSAERWSNASAARALVEEALRYRENANLRLALAKLAFTLNDRQAARDNALRALELSPGDAEAVRMLERIRAAP